MREALRRVAEHGLLGSHHLYITFRTGYPGVDIPDYLRDLYPDELTIVLQHRFWGLEVREEDFSVTLSCNKARARLIADPWVSEASLARQLPGTIFLRVVEREAGGIVSGLDGSEDYLDTGHILTGTPKIYSALAKLCATEIKAILHH